MRRLAPRASAAACSSSCVARRGVALPALSSAFNVAARADARRDATRARRRARGQADLSMLRRPGAARACARRRTTRRSTAADLDLHGRPRARGPRASSRGRRRRERSRAARRARRRSGRATCDCTRCRSSEDGRRLGTVVAGVSLGAVRATASDRADRLARRSRWRCSSLVALLAAVDAAARARRSRG